MTQLVVILLLLNLLLPPTAQGSETRDTASGKKTDKEPDTQLSKEDQDVIAQLELMEMLEMLENLETITAMEDTQ